MATKVCKKCSKEKDLKDFYKDKRGKQGRYATCKACVTAKRSPEFKRKRAEWAKKYRALNKKEIALRQKARYDPYRNYIGRLMSVHRLTEEDVRSMMDSQRGCCTICSESLPLVPHIDHCHTTGKIRSLLCAGCNVGIGHLKDSHDICMRAAAYLMSHNYKQKEIKIVKE